MKTVLIISAVTAIIAALIPLLASKKWWVRAFDFPHLQLTVFSFIVFIFFIFHIDFSVFTEVLLLIILFGTLVYQSNIILPYTILSKKQLADSKNPDEKNTIKILTSNVFQENKQADRLLRLIKKCNPDCIILLETDFKWQKNLQLLKEEYPYTVEHPLDNFYGMMLFSKLKLQDMEVRFLIDNEIPSIKGKIKLKNGVDVNLYCLHPMPPSPTENEKSLDRDAELLLVAKEIKEKDYPVLVIGDLNDVAWSHTTRMFQRISRLLDPRIGRGFYNTFHVKYPFFRWPLDHLFVSNDFKLVALECLQDIGSDHYPVFAELEYCIATSKNESPDQASAKDKKEATETIQEGQEENGKLPNQ